MNILFHKTFILFLFLTVGPNAYSQAIPQCTTYTTSNSYPQAKKIWKLSKHFLFEIHSGFYIKKINQYEFFSFKSKNEEIVTINKKNNDYFHVVTRTTRGYTLYGLDLKTIQLKYIYKKILQFTLNGERYSSPLVDIIFYNDEVYVATNFDILTFDRSVFLKDGSHYKYQNLIPFYYYNVPHRIVALRKINLQLQALYFYMRKYYDPSLIEIKSLSSHSRQTSSEHLSKIYMKVLNENHKHRLFVYRNRSGSTIISDDEKFQLTLNSYIISADFENNDIRREYGLVQIKGLGLFLLKDGQIKCSKNIQVNQVIIKERTHSFIKFLSLDSSQRIKEETILLN